MILNYGRGGADASGTARCSELIGSFWACESELIGSETAKANRTVQKGAAMFLRSALVALLVAALPLPALAFDLPRLTFPAPAADVGQGCAAPATPGPGTCRPAR
jgi:hypothetical protein